MIRAVSNSEVSPLVSAYTDPAAWGIPGDASEGTVSMNTSGGPRVLCTLPDVDGSFVMRPNGQPAAFALRLPLPIRPAGLREDEPSTLFWESVDLWQGLAPNDVVGRARLRLGRREVFTAVSCGCAQIPAGRPYLKLVLETSFPARSLRWPSGVRLRRVVLRLLTEIRPTGTSGAGGATADL